MPGRANRHELINVLLDQMERAPPLDETLLLFTVTCPLLSMKINATPFSDTPLLWQNMPLSVITECPSSGQAPPLGKTCLLSTKCHSSQRNVPHHSMTHPYSRQNMPPFNETCPLQHKKICISEFWYYLLPIIIGDLLNVSKNTYSKVKQQQYAYPNQKLTWQARYNVFGLWHCTETFKHNKLQFLSSVQLCILHFAFYLERGGAAFAAHYLGIGHKLTRTLWRMCAEL